jgi:hypothetical protein
MQARVKKLISEFDELLKPDPLDVDTAKLIEAINFADGKPGIPDGLLEKAEEKLLIAEEEQEKRRQEIRAAAAAVIEKLLSPTPMFLDVEELTKAMAAGEEVSVDKDVLDRAHGKIRVAARRTAAASSLQYLATANPDEADVSALRAAMKEATDAGVQMEAVRDAQFVLRAAEKAQVCDTRALGRGVRACAPLPPFSQTSPPPPPASRADVSFPWQAHVRCHRTH